MVPLLIGAKYGKVTCLDGIECSASAWAVWTALCTFCDWQCTKRGLPVKSKAGTCYPSTRQLAIRGHISQRSVTYGIRELERLGYVRTEARSGDKNQYTLYPLGDAPCTRDIEGDIEITPENLREYGLHAVRGIIKQLNGGVDDDTGDSAMPAMPAEA